MRKSKGKKKNSTSSLRRSTKTSTLKRKRVTKTEPWGVYPDWTTSRWWTFLRSGLRSLSRRWPPIYKCLNEAKRPYVGPNKLQKWEAQCNICKEWWKLKEVSVDHIIPAGELRNYDDLVPFVERLFCPVEGLQVMCKPCHSAKTILENDARKKKYLEQDDG